eukprot:gnl/MRDRNA2_/MRDRNA2_166646_c0_seq1.p1 gnl/MRDRNA2_/MRDRNA2_166646_c0~~gnl/MRDRNA2_/MRDRNA2_166646_c0_seq1.p1  ORF type:complete len:443 (-),score=94.01 gnl/MRDRNA2_/MRDRNA2_166646_c0_seq1:3-1331(-)
MCQLVRFFEGALLLVFSVAQSGNDVTDNRYAADNSQELEARLVQYVEALRNVSSESTTIKAVAKIADEAEAVLQAANRASDTDTKRKILSEGLQAKEGWVRSLSRALSDLQLNDVMDALGGLEEPVPPTEHAEEHIFNSRNANDVLTEEKEDQNVVFEAGKGGIDADEEIAAHVAKLGRMLQKGVREGSIDVAEKFLRLLHDKSSSVFQRILNWQDDNVAVTALMWCSFYGQDAHVLLAKLLLQYGADATLLDKHGRSACHTACARGHRNVLAVLLNHSYTCDPVALSLDGANCIHLAAKRGDAETLQFLYEYSILTPDTADVLTNSDSNNGLALTALWMAVNEGAVEATRVLLESGADPHLDVTSEEGSAPQSPADRAKQRMLTYSTIVAAMEQRPARQEAVVQLAQLNKTNYVESVQLGEELTEKGLAEMVHVNNTRGEL